MEQAGEIKREFKRLKKLVKGEPRLFARLASLELSLGKTKAACKRLENGLKTFPEYTSAKMLYAECLAHLGKHEESLEQWEAVREAEPYNMRALSQYLEEITQDEDPKGYIQKLIELYENDPNNPGIQRRLKNLIQKELSFMDAAVKEWQPEWHLADVTRTGEFARKLAQEVGLTPVRDAPPKPLRPEIEPEEVKQAAKERGAPAEPPETSALEEAIAAEPMPEAPGEEPLVSAPPAEAAEAGEVSEEEERALATLFEEEGEKEEPAAEEVEPGETAEEEALPGEGVPEGELPGVPAEEEARVLPVEMGEATETPEGEEPGAEEVSAEEVQETTDFLASLLDEEGEETTEEGSAGEAVEAVTAAPEAAVEEPEGGEEEEAAPPAPVEFNFPEPTLEEVESLFTSMGIVEDAGQVIDKIPPGALEIAAPEEPEAEKVHVLSEEEEEELETIAEGPSPLMKALQLVEVELEGYPDIEKLIFQLEKGSPDFVYPPVIESIHKAAKKGAEEGEEAGGESAEEAAGREGETAGREPPTDALESITAAFPGEGEATAGAPPEAGAAGIEEEAAVETPPAREAEPEAPEVPAAGRPEEAPLEEPRPTERPGAAEAPPARETEPAAEEAEAVKPPPPPLSAAEEKPEGETAPPPPETAGAPPDRVPSPESPAEPPAGEPAGAAPAEMGEESLANLEQVAAALHISPEELAALREAEGDLDSLLADVRDQVAAQEGDEGEAAAEGEGAPPAVAEAGPAVEPAAPAAPPEARPEAPAETGEDETPPDQLHGPVTKTFARLCLMQGKVEHAAEIARRLLAQSPDDPEVGKLVAEIREAGGDL